MCSYQHFALGAPFPVPPNRVLVAGTPSSGRFLVPTVRPAMVQRKLEELAARQPGPSVGTSIERPRLRRSA
jgi:hypothetical protein